MRVCRGLLVSLPLIVVIAVGARAGFAWNEGRQIPANLVGIVPFQQEAGNIARALAMGKGFSNAFNQGTGATAWLTPVYPLLLAGIFRIFGIFTPASFVTAVALNIAFSAAACVPIFYAGRKIAGVGVGASAAWFWAIFPNAIMIPFEWIWDTCLTAFLSALILYCTLKLAESTRVRDWCLYGLLWGFALMTNPALGSLLPFLLGMGGVPRQRLGTPAFGATRAGCSNGSPLLHALDHAQLYCLPTFRAAPLHVSLRPLAGPQQGLRSPLARYDAGDAL